MDDKLLRIENKIDKLDQRLDNIDLTLARQNVSLEDHIKRTNMLEEEIKPIKALTYQIIGVGKFIGLLSLLCGIIAFVVKVVK